MGEKYKIVLSEIKASGAESITRVIELLEFVSRMDTDNILKTQFNYVLELAKVIGQLKTISDKMKKDQEYRAGEICYGISHVIKELLNMFGFLNKHIEGYTKQSNLDPQYDKKYFPFAAKLMQNYGSAINTLIKVHSKIATDFFRKTGIRQTTY